MNLMVLISMLGILLTPSVAMTTHNVYGQAVDTIELLDNDTAVQPILPMTIPPSQPPTSVAAAVAAPTPPLSIGELEVIPTVTAEQPIEEQPTEESEGQSEEEGGNTEG